MGNYTKAINFSGKVLVIWGNNTTLDAAGKGQFFTAGKGGNGIKTSLQLHVTITISDTKFESNTANNLGGGAINLLSLGSLIIIISDSTFKSNSAYTGGAIYIGDGSLIIQDSSFVSNKATGATLDNDGGAIFASGSGITLTISGTKFKSNTATRWIFSSRFEQNRAYTVSAVFQRC
eukprot:g836.t1